MNTKRVLYIVAAVCFALAWLVAITVITSDTEALTWQALVALGLTLGFVGHAS